LDKILFLGTAGGRLSTFRKIRRSGGMLMHLSGRWVHVDPGPGAFVYLHERGFDPRGLDLLVLSHIHLDHSADVNSLIEASTDGGKRIHIALFAPKSAFEGEDRVVLPYLRKKLALEAFFEEGKTFEYMSIKVKAVMKHRHHNAETYALFLNDKVLYVSCAMFEDRMLSLYPKNVQVMIINTTLYNKRENIEHLSVEDAIKLIKGLNPQKAILTHFGYEFLKNHNPQEVADYITSLTGISTVSAFDNMEVYLH
jgi:phosphoribosyl 1,2-cyclic phosphodiesterase